MEIDARWLAVKEAAVPLVIGLAVMISTRTKYPLVRTLLYNPSVLDVDRSCPVIRGLRSASWQVVYFATPAG